MDDEMASANGVTRLMFVGSLCAGGVHHQTLFDDAELALECLAMLHSDNAKCKQEDLHTTTASIRFTEVLERLEHTRIEL